MNKVCIAANSLLLFLAFLGQNMHIPVWIQVAGRLHPLFLHIPLVLLLIAVVWENLPHTRLLYRMGDYWLGLGACTAALTALTGLFLSKEGGYSEDLLIGHQWGGLVASLFSWGIYVFRDFFRAKKSIRQFGSLILVLCLVWTGHQGASLTHGEDFLTAPLKKKPSRHQFDPATARLYEDIVQPILASKCIGCHNAGKRKGDLGMETPEMLLKGGKNGKLWDTAVTGPGLMMQRIHLPENDKEHMPPAGKPQLTEAEIQILEHWIRLGAPFEGLVSELGQGHPLHALAKELATFPATNTWQFTFADEKDIRRLNNATCSVRPLTAGSPALSVSFFGISTFKPEQIRELGPIHQQIVELNLNRMPLGGADLKVLGQFPNLQKLNLAATGISGKSLEDALTPLRMLRQLSLAETDVKIPDLDFLASLPNIKQVFLWNTGVRDSSEFQELRTKFPHIQFESGFRDNGKPVKLNAPGIETPKDVFTSSTRVHLKNFISGAQLRYTLDGTAPDSLHAQLYTGDSISIEKSCLLRTRSFLPGWISSEITERQFYKIGALPDSVWLSYAPNPQYKSEGARTLFNQKVGDTDFRSPQWLAFRENPAEIWLYFTTPRKIGEITLSSLVDIGSYIMPPADIEVWGGTEEKRLVLLKKIKPEQPQAPGGTTKKSAYSLRFPARPLSFVKILVRPLSRLPAWHPGKGDRGWVFLDEIFIQNGEL